MLNNDEQKQVHSEAAILILLCDDDCASAPQEGISGGWSRIGNLTHEKVPLATDHTHLIQPCSDCDGYRDALQPYAVPASCRIEVLADMKRAVTDCRQNFGQSADPVGAIFEALFAICPDATAAELDAVLEAAQLELQLKLGRIGWDYECVGVTRELETWREVAKGRFIDLGDAQINIDLCLQQHLETYNGPPMRG